jgi:hypothetical protein
MFIVTIMLSICLTIILFLHPQNKKWQKQGLQKVYRTNFLKPLI